MALLSPSLELFMPLLDKISSTFNVARIAIFQYQVLKFSFLVQASYDVLGVHQFESFALSNMQSVRNVALTCLKVVKLRSLILLLENFS